MMKQWIKVTVLSLGCSGCVAPGVVDTGTSTSMRDMISREWGVDWPSNAKDIQVLFTTGMRVSTYPDPAYIQANVIAHLGTPRARLEGLCRREQGQFKFVGFSAQPSKPHPLPQSSAYQQDMARAVNQGSLDESLKAAEAANQRESARIMMNAVRSMPDRLTQDALNQAQQKQWLGDFMCTGGTEAWRASIRFEKWWSAMEPKQVVKYVVLNTTITMD